MLIITKHDIVWDCPKPLIERAVKAAGGVITHYEEHGPAGGNHYVECKFEYVDNAAKMLQFITFLTWYINGDDEANQSVR